MKRKQLSCQVIETTRGFLTHAVGQPVLVQLRYRQLRGKLAGADEFINLVLEDMEELGPKGNRKIAGPVVVRGSHVIAIHATKLGPPIAASVREPVWSGRASDRGG